MTIRPGEFWVADIPYTDQSATKKRPVLVLWLDGADVVAAVVTSSRRRTQTDVELKEWREGGLRVASTVRLSRLDCLEGSLLQYRLGAISTTDGSHLKSIWEQYVKPQF
jgi:mRNA-degrading endonuclease toxin of MazEF toxin-antitoxin module